MNQYTKKWPVVPKEQGNIHDKLFGIPPLRNLLQFTRYCDTYAEIKRALSHFSSDRLRIISSVIDDILMSRGREV